MNSEEWRFIEGYEGYMVSNYGNVKNAKTGLSRKLSIDKGGYYRVTLRKNGITKYVCVHRLVATAFIDNPYGKRTVNHIDGNKRNNMVTNLEWNTHSENLNHAIRMGLKKPSDKQRMAASVTGKRTCELNRPKKPVIKTTADGIETYYESAHEGARSVYGDASPIVRCCKGKLRTYKGCKWRYANAN